MKTKISLLLLAILCNISVFAQSDFDKYFEKKSLRVDFALSGNLKSQSAAIQGLREEPVWGGPVKNLIDKFNYGGYYINVYDKATNKLIYSRGFNTLFDKADMQFHPLLKQEVDPKSIFIDRGKLKANKVHQIQKSGDSTEKVDLVFIAEGYTADEQEKFVADANRFTEALFATPPFTTRRNDFNVWAVCLVSEESGTDVSGKGIFKNTALNSGYYTFGVDRYLTTPDMKSIRDAVWNVPCDAIFLLINTDMYGGGGMYNFYACGTADNPRTPVVFTHEFGHSFAGLADEYFSSEVAYQDFYNLKYEPWEPNITTLVDFGSKWKDLLPADTPIPTPLDAGHKDKAGVFEGGGYLSKGIYRPMDHCMMRDYAPFCPACSRAILQMVDFLTDK